MPINKDLLNEWMTHQATTNRNWVEILQSTLTLNGKNSQGQQGFFSNWDSKTLHSAKWTQTDRPSKTADLIWVNIEGKFLKNHKFDLQFFYFF